MAKGRIEFGHCIGALDALGSARIEVPVQVERTTYLPDGTRSTYAQALKTSTEGRVLSHGGPLYPRKVSPTSRPRYRHH